MLQSYNTYLPVHKYHPYNQSMNLDQNTHPVAEARTNLSELLNRVAILRRVHYVTHRGRPRAAFVPYQLGELIDAVGGPEEAAAILKEHTA